MKFFKTKRKEVKKEVTKGVRNAVNALTFDLDRGPFGTLNLSKLMIKPNANSDSTIELSGNTIRIKTSEGNTGKIRVGLVCNESGTSCKDVQTLLRYGDIEWKQIPISWTLSKVLLPESTWSNVWIWKSTDLGVITEADEKLWVIWKTRLEWDLTVSGGKITVYQICDETGKCKKVSELSTWGDTTITDSEWSVTWVIVFWKTINVLQPKNLGNHVWIWNYDENNKWDYRLRVVWKTQLEWDLLVTGGDITVYQICDENGNCKKVSELYTWNWGGGWDVYWKKSSDVNPTLITSWNFSSIKLESNLTVDNKNEWKVNVYQICDTGGHNCRVVTDISTGWTNYWKINSNKLTASWTFYGLELSSANIWASYSFEIKDSENLHHPTKTKVLVDGNWLTVTWATTLNNDLTVDGTTIANSGVRITSGGLTVTWNTTLNSHLTVKNGLTVTSNNGSINLVSTNIFLHGTSKIDLQGTKNFMGGDVNITGNTTITGQLNVNGGIDMTTGSLRIEANKDSGFQISKKQNLNQYSTIFRVHTISDTYNIGVIWDTYIEWDTTIQWTTNLYWDTVIAWWNTTIGWSNITIDTNWWDIIIDWNTTTIRWDTTVKNKLYVGNDNNNCYESGNVNCYASDSSFDEISQIRFVPKTFDNQKQISDVKQCDRSIEWTLVYWRDKNQRSDQWYTQDARLSICMCALKTLYNVQQPNKCEWKNIALLDY